MSLLSYYLKQCPLDVSEKRFPSAENSDINYLIFTVKNYKYNIFQIDK